LTLPSLQKVCANRRTLSRLPTLSEFASKTQDFFKTSNSNHNEQVTVSFSHL
jgi:hypothetical protein